MHDASCNGSINYLNLAREILQKNDQTRINQEDKIIEVDEGVQAKEGAEVE